MSKSFVTVLFCLVVVASPALAAQSPKPKAEVAKIAVGPKNLEETKEIADDPATSGDTDPNLKETTDGEESPALKPIVASTPAPQADGAPAPPLIDEGNDEGEREKGAPALKAEEVAKPSLPAMTVKLRATRPTATKANTATKATSIKKSSAKSSASKATAPKAIAPAVSKAAPETGDVVNVSAEQSLKWLTNGNTRFVTKKFRADGRSAADRARVAKAQKPHAIILSCSDSRVPPELIFDQGLGEITTIRVAGEVLDSSVIASIETAIQNEHPHLLVVLGHTRCESIEAALNWKEKATNGSDALDRMVSEIKPHLRSLAPGAPSAGLQVESVLQADGVARDLADQSEIIKKALESHELTIKTGLYGIDTGEVKFY